jgi:arylsulfate sulfotransferase
MRHQNWIIKLDYQDGRGSGNILWKLGSGGDFELKGGIDPNDWFYAQHAPVITSPNSSGVFEMLLFGNGNDRIVDGSGDLCGGTGQPACYSKVPILQVDENARTAQIVWQDTLPSFSFFGGYAQEFSNNNIEFDESASSSTPPSASIFEVTQDPSPQLVLQMDVVGQYAYRAFRIPSLYPGVQW